MALHHAALRRRLGRAIIIRCIVCGAVTGIGSAIGQAAYDAAEKEQGWKFVFNDADKQRSGWHCPKCKPKEE